jgi:parallel beta-helix repeat protein
MRETQSKLSRQQRRALERAGGKGRKIVASGAALTLGVALAAGRSAQAATFNVVNLDDAGPGSLRQAIEDANAAAGADVITFQAGLSGTILLTSGQLAITDSVDIQGPGASLLAVNGNGSSRVFYLYNNAAVLDVTISGLTVTFGSATIGAGIVDFDENLTLDGVVISQNAVTGDGGGLWADGFNMTLTIRNSRITGNTADDDGGAIYVEDTGGPLTIQNTVITGNFAGGSGGGIYFYDPDTDVTIQDSTISGNTAGRLGGGIYLYSPDAGSWVIRNTTISGNSAQEGGGLFLYQPDQPFLIENSTISGNQATAGDGGGIYLYGYSITIHNSTIAGNTATGSGGGVFAQNALVTIANSIVGDNAAGTNNDLGNGVEGSFDASFSLVESPGTASLTDSGGNVLNQDPQLGPLQNNGGPTETQLPAGTSPAVNAGDPAFTPPPSTDQRGFPRVVNGRIDMGAVEINPGMIQLTVSAASVNENGGTVTITATRTGGFDGAVAVSYATSDGTATQPADYIAAAGTLNWANQDAAPKSFQVTIVNDSLDEPDETFNVTISNPQGGAALGAPTAEVVTIIDDDVPPVVTIPTLGESGKVLLAVLCGLGGLVLLRRRKGLAAPMLAASLTLGAAGGAQAAGPGRPVAPVAEFRAAALAQIHTNGDAVVIRLADGTRYEISSRALKVIDRRRGHRGETPDIAALPANQPIVLKVKRGRDGAIRRVRIQVVDTAAKAQAAAKAQRK